MHTEIEAPEGCTWCTKEVGLLHKASGFSPQEIEAYTSFYGILGTGPRALGEVRRTVGLSREEAELTVMEVADWLTANSPFRSLPRRCWVCSHAQGPEDLAHLKEPVVA